MSEPGLPVLVCNEPTRANVTIRICCPADVPAVREIYAAHISGLATFEEETPALGEMERRRAAIQASGYPFLVAEEAGEVVGYAYAERFKERSAYRYSASNSVYVDATRTARGVGSRLLRAVLTELKAMGIRQVVAICGTLADNPGTHALHSKFGYRQVALLPSIGFKNGQWLDRAYLQLALDDFDPTSIPQDGIQRREPLGVSEE